MLKNIFFPSTGNMIKNVFNYRGLKMWKNLEEKSPAGFTFLSKLASFKIIFLKYYRAKSQWRTTAGAEKRNLQENCQENLDS